MARRKKKTGTQKKRGGRKPGKWEFVTPEAIQAFRAEQGLSRAKLASQLGVSTTSIQNWEAGRPASVKIQRQLKDMIAGGVGATVEALALPAAGQEADASAIRTTGNIVAAYLQSQKTALPPAQLAKLVRSVRLALS